MQGCTALLDLGPPSAQNTDAITKEVGALNELVLYLQEPLPADKAEQAKIEKSWKRLVEVFACWYLTDGDEELVGLNQVANLLFTLPHLMSTVVPSSSKATECLQWGQEFLEKLGALKTKCDAEDGALMSEKMMEPLRSVRRHQIKVEHARKTWSELSDLCQECEEAWQGFMMKYEAHSAVFSSMVGKVQARAKDILTRASMECGALCGGRKNGAKWSDVSPLKSSHPEGMWCNILLYGV